jgi:hypothetical protein
MINITRNTTDPLSLQTAPIKKYLDELVIYKNLSTQEQAEIDKPKCSQSYRNEDLFEAFDRDFFAKCYLTEKAFSNSYAMDVEHFRAKAFDQYPELKYEWSNLYPADHDANMVKPRIDPVGGYLDPCEVGDDVEKEIKYSIAYLGEVHFEAKNSLNIKAVNTANLLDRIHNGDDYASNQKTKNLRDLIDKRRNEILELIVDWLGAEKRNDSQMEFDLRKKLQKYLSRKSSFTMLMRSMSAVKLHFPEELLD